MPWITITEEDIKTRLTGPEVAAIKTAALASGQPDPLPITIAATVAEIRGRLRNVTALETGSTIPDSLRLIACDIIRMRLTTRIPDPGFSTPERLLEYGQAMAVIEKLGPVVPDSPATPDTTPTAQRGIPLIVCKVIVFDRASQEGI